jgi:hypothetical protein
MPSPATPHGLSSPGSWPSQCLVGLDDAYQKIQKQFLLFCREGREERYLLRNDGGTKFEIELLAARRQP